MREEHLLEGVTDTLTMAGWLWAHHRRSDLGILQGTPGVPDLFAAHPDRLRDVLALELKSDHGQPTPDQSRWLRALDGRTISARLVYPEDYDALIVELVGDRLQHKRRRA